MSEGGEERRFGSLLQGAREGRGLGRPELAARTRIQERYLEALEAEDWAGVPAGVIGRGFVRSLAKELGRDPAELLEAYREARGDEDAEPTRSLPEADWKVALRDDRSRSPLILGLLFLAGALLGIWVWSPWNVADRESPEPAAPPAAEAPGESLAPPTDEPAPPEPAIAAAPAPEPEPPAPVSDEAPAVAPVVAVSEPPPAPPPPTEAAEVPPPEPQGHTLEVQAVERTWVRVKADGGAPQDRVLDPGERRAYEARERVTVRLGNAGGVRLFWDGRALKVPGAPGAVMNLAFPHDLEDLRP